MFFNRIKRKFSGSAKHVIFSSEQMVNGQLNIANTKLSAATCVNGELKANDVVFKKSVEVNGSAKVQGCTFNQDLLVRGTPLLKDVTIHGNFEAVAGVVKLDKCKVFKIFMTHPCQSTLWPQKVILKDVGNVELVSFSHPGGIVKCEGNSEVKSILNGTEK